MHRLGMADIEMQRIIDNPSLLSGLELQYVISHLSAYYASFLDVIT